MNAYVRPDAAPVREDAVCPAGCCGPACHVAMGRPCCGWCMTAEASAKREADDREWSRRVTAPGQWKRPAATFVDMTSSVLLAEHSRWIADGCPSSCVRPAGEAFGWRQGSGPCDCPPCLAASTAAWEPRTDWGATV